MASNLISSISLNQSKTTKKNGVTLIELLVTAAVISILASLTITTFPAILARSRDGRRKSDLKIISSALEQFYADKNYYPSDNTANAQNFTSNSGDNPWIKDLTQEYIKSLPKDPNSSSYYEYSTLAGHQSYVIWASLERDNDPESINGSSSTCNITHPIFPPSRTFCVQSP